MANQRRSFVISDGLWLAALEVARQRRESLSEVIRDALRRYVRRYRMNGAEMAMDELAPMNQRCGLCGESPTTLDGHPFFGGSWNGVPLHHDDNPRIDVGIERRITCYEAWTTYGRRP